MFQLIYRQALALGGCLVALSLAASANQPVPSIYRLLPQDWPVVMRYDRTSATASGAFLQELYSTPEGKHMKQASSVGMAKMMQAIGIDIDVEKGIAPWWNQTMSMAVNPNIQPIPGMIVVVGSKNQQMAEAALRDAMGSIIRGSDPVVQVSDVGRVYLWTMEDLDMKPAYIVGRDFVVFAESIESLRLAMAAFRANKSAETQAKFALNKDALIAFHVDASDIAGQMMQGIMGGVVSGGEETMPGDVNPMMAQLLEGGVAATGGLNVSKDGFVMEVNGKLPPFLLMAASMFTMEASGDASGLAAHLPQNSVAAAALASAQFARPVVARMAPPQPVMIPEGEEEPVVAGSPPASELGVLSAMLKAAGNKPVAMAVTALLPRPALVAICKPDQPVAAAQMLDSFQAELEALGLTIGDPEGSGKTKLVYPIKQVTESGERKMGYLGRDGNLVVWGSDYRSAMQTLDTVPARSLASRNSYRETMNLLPSKSSSAHAWVNLDMVSGMGYLYDAMMAMWWLGKPEPFSEALMGTKGVALSVGLDDKGVHMHAATRTNVNLATPLIMAYGGMYAGFIAMFVGMASRNSIMVEDYSQVLSELNQIAIATTAYMETKNGAFPDPENWREQIGDYAPGLPIYSGPGAGSVDYRMNTFLKGKTLGDLEFPENTILFYLGTEGESSPDRLFSPDGMRRFVLFADGTAQPLYEPPAMNLFDPDLEPYWDDEEESE